jgi:hypothetical protein
MSNPVLLLIDITFEGFGVDPGLMPMQEDRMTDEHSYTYYTTYMISIIYRSIESGYIKAHLQKSQCVPLLETYTTRWYGDYYKWHRALGRYITESFL